MEINPQTKKMKLDATIINQHLMKTRTWIAFGETLALPDAKQFGCIPVDVVVEFMEQNQCTAREALARIQSAIAARAYTHADQERDR
jgi:hypothetical protein